MIALEQLADGSVSDRNFQKLMSLVMDTGGQTVGIRFGTGTWTFPGGQSQSSIATISHGLGRTPVLVGTFSVADNGTEALTGQAFTYTGTTFGSRGMFKAFTPAAAATYGFVWVVIG